MTQVFDFIRVADVESTGFPPGAEICEIGWTDLRYYPDGWQIEDDQRSAFVNPGFPIPAEASDVHGITDDMVADGMDPDEARRFIAAGPSILAAHNAAFDRQFLRGHKLPWICTLQAARLIWPGLPSHKNETLKEFLGIVVTGDAHRAGYDAAVTARVLLEILDMRSIDELIEISRPEYVPLRMPFGKKWKGAKFSEIDDGYLNWIIRTDDIQPGIKTAARNELARRAQS